MPACHKIKSFKRMRAVISAKRKIASSLEHGCVACSTKNKRSKIQLSLSRCEIKSSKHNAAWCKYPYHLMLRIYTAPRVVIICPTPPLLRLKFPTKFCVRILLTLRSLENELRIIIKPEHTNLALKERKIGEKMYKGRVMIDMCREGFSESDDYCLVLVDSFFCIDNMQVKCPLDTPIADLERVVYSRVPAPALKLACLSSKNGTCISLSKSVKELCGEVRESPYFVSLLLWLRLRGGKGGFGQLLKAKGHKMNKKSNSGSKDLYKTLDGRYVKTLKKLKQMEQMESLTDSERQKIHEKKEKLQKILNTDVEKNVKYEDTEFLEDIESFVGKIKESVESDENDSSSEEDSQESDREEESPPSSSKSKFQLFFDEPVGKGKENEL